MPAKELKLLVFGDVYGKLGRRAVAAVLPQLKEKYQPDIVFANVENLAHGSGVTRSTWQELVEAGVQVGTGGNHILEKPDVAELLADPAVEIVRPANYTDPQLPGVGYRVVNTPVGDLLVINLLGQLFVNNDRLPVDNPFAVVEAILSRHPEQKLIVVDFHAEATSEKVAMARMLDGKVSAVWGSHTHVATADTQLLPQGTAYVTDVGLVGGADSVVGLAAEPIIAAYLAGSGKGRAEPPEHGAYRADVVLITLNAVTSKALSIVRVDAMGTV